MKKLLGLLACVFGAHRWTWVIGDGRYDYFRCTRCGERKSNRRSFER